jgi:hypothetical protein
MPLISFSACTTFLATILGAELPEEEIWSEVMLREVPRHATHDELYLHGEGTTPRGLINTIKPPAPIYDAKAQYMRPRCKYLKYDL